ncbi:MAG: hypothetical protein IK016_03160 [Lachnospiraceae bacterium]|nr:hypothetical protein [Lachnospiraceae bacterium]
MTPDQTNRVNKETMPHMYARLKDLPRKQTGVFFALLMILSGGFILCLFVLVVVLGVTKDGMEAALNRLSWHMILGTCILVPFNAYLVYLGVLFLTRERKRELKKCWWSFSDVELQQIDEECRNAPVMGTSLVTRPAVLIRNGSHFTAVPVKSIEKIHLRYDRRYSVEKKDFYDLHITQKDGHVSIVNDLAVPDNERPEDAMSVFYTKTGFHPPVQVTGRTSRENDIDAHYDPDTHPDGRRFEDVCFERFARTQKTMVKQFLKERLPVPPHRVFASSAPGLNIVYGKTEYEQMRIDELKDDLCAEITEIAKKYVESTYGFPMTCDFRVVFYHTEMEHYNAYGLSRED